MSTSKTLGMIPAPIPWIRCGPLTFLTSNDYKRNNHNENVVNLKKNYMERGGNSSYATLII
jgi:hypothetical protein